MKNTSLTPEPRGGKPHRIFLLSPARLTGKRALSLLREGADFDLAIRLRGRGASLGHIFSFMSGLYFRGKFTYAQTFAVPPAGVAGSWVITCSGLVPTDTAVTLETLLSYARGPLDCDNARYMAALRRDSRRIAETAGDGCSFVLLGSIATPKYLDPLAEIFGQRLLFPETFVGRGDLSRGGLLLRSAESRTELDYIPLGRLPRHGPRPARLPL